MQFKTITIRQAWLLCCLCLCFNVFSPKIQAIESHTEEAQYTYKNINDWHNQVDTLSQNIPDGYISVNDLENQNTHSQLKYFQNLGEMCEQYLFDNIDEISKELAILGESPDQDTSVVAIARRSLNSEELRYQRKLTSCKLLTVKTEKLLKQIISLNEIQTRHQRMFRSYDFIDLIMAIPKLQLWSTASHIVKTPNWSANLTLLFWLTWFGLLVLLATTTAYIRKKRFTFIKPITDDSITHRVAHSFLLNNHLLLILLGSLLFSWVYFFTIEFLTEQQLPLTQLLSMMSLTVIFLCLTNSFFSPLTNSIGLIRLPDLGLKVVRRHTRFLIFYMFLLHVQSIWPTPVDINTSTTETLRFALLAALIHSSSRVLWHLLSEFPLRYFRPLKYIVPPLAIAGGILLIFGFINLIEFGTRAIVSSYFILLTAYVGYRIASDLLDSLDEGRYGWQKHIKNLLDINEKEIMPGIIWLRIFLVAFVYISFGIALINNWSASHIDIQQLIEYASKGIKLGSLKIVPMQIIEAIVFVALSFPLLGWARKQFDLRVLSKSRMDVGARDALSSILMYGLGLLVLLIGLSMAGVDLSNIAIIAGALSLGIGFGLQTIVNNFVSGLILLLERPIKKGDWIIVDATEGYVKQISVRSTLIQTFDHADVIVPNSDLITHVVKNWTFKNHTGRICIPISIAYDSNVNLARDILLAIANERTEVKTDEGINPPQVLFLHFGDSAIDLELRFFVQTVNDSMRLASEVRFAILERFNENNINIPFPQRVIKIEKGYE